MTPTKQKTTILPSRKATEGKIKTRTKKIDIDKNGTLKVIPLGGLGGVGKNMTVLEYKDDILIIDIGLMFPQEDMPGIDFIIPNIKYLENKKDKIRGIILTHGHLDHTGAFPYLQEKLGNPPIYTADLTKGLLIKRHQEFRHLPKPEIHTVKGDDIEKFGDYFEVRFFHVNHTIPDDLALVIKTPVGTIFHTSDFKFDATPLNEEPVDLIKLKKIGDEGVLLLTSDSTGAENSGHSISEKTIQENLEIIFKESKSLIIASTFASLINRIQQLIELSEKYDRKVIFDGLSMKSNVEIAKELKYIKIKKGTQIDVKQFHEYPRSKITLIATGAQGQGNAVLMRIANREHRHIDLIKNDSVIFSSSVVPGNERAVQNVKDQLYHAGAKVYHYKMMDIHSGGHAQQDDLKEMIRLIRPKFFMPIHGQFSMMVNHGWLAEEEKIDEKNIILAENGSIINLKHDNWSFDKEKAPMNNIYVDGLGVGDIGNVVLRDRQVLADDGMFVIVALIDSRTGKVRQSPDIISRGFVYLRENKELLSDVRKRVKSVIESKTTTGSVNWVYLKDEVRNKIGLFLFQKTQRRPMVLPVIIEV